MALTEDRVLVSFEINVQFSTISILWHNRILRDGEAIPGGISNHRAAYNLEDGEIPEHIRQEFNISMAQLTDEALLEFSRANSELSHQLVAANARIAELEALHAGTE